MRHLIILLYLTRIQHSSIKILFSCMHSIQKITNLHNILKSVLKVFLFTIHGMTTFWKCTLQKTTFDLKTLQSCHILIVGESGWIRLESYVNLNQRILDKAKSLLETMNHNIVSWILLPQKYPVKWCTKRQGTRKHTKIPWPSVGRLSNRGWCQ